MAFPSIDHIGPIAAAQHRLGVTPKGFSDYAEAREHAINAPNTTEVWAIVKKGWSLTNRGLLDLAAEQFKKYPAAGFDGKAVARGRLSPTGIYPSCWKTHDG